MKNSENETEKKNDADETLDPGKHWSKSIFFYSACNCIKVMVSYISPITIFSI